MSFVAPLFLFGLFAVALPILLHLSRRRQTNIVDFPSLMFLSRVPYRSVRRRQVRDLLLMLLRCAAYCLIALAFARPFFVASAADRGDARLHRVIAVDQSYSMNRDTVWADAQQAALESIASLPEDALATLVGFDESGRVVLSSSGGAEDIRAAASSLQPTDFSTRYASATKTVRQVFLDAPTPRRELVLISDFQRVGRNLGDDLSLPAGTDVSVISLPKSGTGEVGNVSVSEIELDRSGAGASDRSRIVVSARVLRSGGSDEIEVEAKLSLGGRETDRQTVQLGANEAKTVTFAAARQEPGVVSRGTVRLDVTDEVLIDNEFRFVLSPAQGIPVVVVKDGRGSARFLQEAFELGRDPFFKPRLVRAADLKVTDLADQPVLVLDDSLHALSSSGLEAVKQHVAGGGGMLVTYGKKADRAGQAAAALGLPMPEKVRRSRSGDQGLSYLDYDHPALKLFSAPRSGDFSSIRIFAFHELAPLSSSSRVIARFSNGAPALVEIGGGAGRILVWPTTLDTSWGDLPIQPIFLPVLHQLSGYLADHRAGREWYTVGQVLDLAAQLEKEGVEEAERSSWLVLSPDGTETRLDQEDSMLLNLNARGFWRIRPIGSAAGQELLTIAANLEPREADLEPLDTEIFESGLNVQAAEIESSQDGPLDDLAPSDDRQRGWWYLLGLLLLILGAESWLGARRSRGRVATRIDADGEAPA